MTCYRLHITHYCPQGMTVAHDEFRAMGLLDVERLMNEKPVLIDVRGMFDEEDARCRGFVYQTL